MEEVTIFSSSKLLSQDLINIFNSLYDGIFITDREGFCIWVNNAYERISGLSAEELIGKNVNELVESGIVSKAVSIDVLRKKERKTINQKLYNGKELLVTGNPIYGDNGQIEMVVTNVRNINELYQLMEQVNRNDKPKERYSLEVKISQKEKKEGLIRLKSPSMQNIYELINRISNVDSNVLIYGETGVGKEPIANLIHQSSIRKEKPFIKINCASIPEHLLESELFGYEGGAFTGAKKTGKIGLFELANEGTLLLDEIGELPIALQAKLLRAIQNQEIIPVGGEKVKQINVRIIAATNRNLTEEIKLGRFRQDLYYRLNVVPINIPPLRERPEDIFYLSQFFLEKMNQKYKLNKRFSYQLINFLEKYHWPGNIRELENVIERLLVTTTEEVLEVDHIKKMFEYEDKEQIKPIRLAVEETEAKLIKKTIDIYDSTSKAAKVLGIDRSTLIRKRKKYDI